MAESDFEKGEMNANGCPTAVLSVTEETGHSFEMSKLQSPENSSPRTSNENSRSNGSVEQGTNGDKLITDSINEQNGRGSAVKGSINSGNGCNVNVTSANSSVVDDNMPNTSDFPPPPPPSNASALVDSNLPVFPAHEDAILYAGAKSSKVQNCTCNDTALCDECLKNTESVKQYEEQEKQITVKL